MALASGARLAGKTALVTGSSAGIGFGIAQAFAGEGCAVIHLVGRNTAELEHKAEVLRAQSATDVRIHSVDLGQADAVSALAAECAGLDILVNNAGAIPRGPLLEIDAATWRSAWDVKVFGYIDLTRAFYREMAARKSGVVLNIVGSAGEAPNADYIAAGSGNAALIYFTQALGGASLADGVRVLGINPGPVLTERFVTGAKRRAETRYGDAERYEETFSLLPLGRPATIDEVALLAVFLASEDAAYISGTLVRIDGGLNARPPAF